MSDLIKRKDVLDAICDNCKLETDFDRYKACGNCKDVKMIMDIPSAERKGEWIEHKERTIVMDNNFVDFFPTEYECSNCGFRRAAYFINSQLSNYCPNCGARMKGADDE